MLKKKMWFAFRNRPLTYISEESEKTIEKMQMEEEKMQQRLIKENRKMEKKKKKSNKQKHTEDLR